MSSGFQTKKLNNNRECELAANQAEAVNQADPVNQARPVPGPDPDPKNYNFFKKRTFQKRELSS